MIEYWYTIANWHPRFPPQGGFRFLWEWFLELPRELCKDFCRHCTYFSLESFRTKNSNLGKYNRSFSSSYMIWKIIFSLSFPRSHGKSKKLILIEFFIDEYWSLKKFIFSILFSTYIFSDTTPPDISFPKKKLSLFCIDISFLHIPALEELASGVWSVHKNEKLGIINVDWVNFLVAV